MISRLILLRVLMYDEQKYSLEDLKNELFIDLDEHLYGLLMKYLSKTIKIMTTDKEYEMQLKKTMDYIELMTIENPEFLKMTSNREKMYSIFKSISKRSNELKKNFDKEILNLLNYTFDKMSFVESLCITANIQNNDVAFAFLNKLLFEEKNYTLFKQLTKVYPKIINVTNPRNGEPLYIMFFKKYLREMRKDGSIERLIYFDNTSELMVDAMKHLHYQFGDFDIRYEIEKRVHHLEHHTESMDRNIKLMLLSKLNNYFFCEKDYLSNASFINYKTNLSRGYVNERDYCIGDKHYEIIVPANEHIVTIDSEYASALDDAISIKKLSNGNYLMGIYISDVASYISRNDELDLDACTRGATIYLNNGRQIPMLPNNLSFDICSLFPQKPKRVMATFVEINPRGDVEGFLMKRCNIVSNRKMTYHEVDSIIRNQEDHSRLANELRMMYEVSRVLASRNKQKRCYRQLDSIIGNRNEINMEHATKLFDSKGSYSHSIVSESMILLNYLVAKAANEAKIPFLYRIHEYSNISEINQKCKTLTGLFKTDEGFFASDLFRKQIMNSYLKPKYSSENKGHNGIGLDFYSHTSSPIRRYSDLFNQRVIGDLMINPYPSDHDFYYYEEHAPKIAFIQNENEELIEKFIEDYHLTCMEQKEYVRK